MINKELARAFDLMADLMEIQGRDRFRITAYRRAARTLKDLAEDVAEVAQQGRLEELQGIGKGTATKVRQFIAEGRIAELETLKGQVPEGLPALLHIPGLGPKKIAVLWRELDIHDVASLKEALAAERLQDLAGFGEQSARKIAEGIAFLERSGQRVPLGRALELAETLQALLDDLPGVRCSAIAGSLRRGRETVGDVDLLCVAADGPAAVQSFVQLPGVSRVLAAGTTKGSATFELGAEDRELQVDLRVVPETSFGAALQYFTGSKEHNVRLRERAVRQGLKLNEWGLFDGQQHLAGRTEEDVYAHLGVIRPPPEQREDRGELDREADFFTGLITLADIRGDLHVHTTASDGRSTLQDMAAAASQRGYAFLNITDHSRSSVVAGGLSIEDMQAHIAGVRAFSRTFEGLAVLIGCECDILADGDLDYPDELLAQCDIVVASIHAAQTQDADRITKRTIKALRNPYVDILGHPTGRLLNRRSAAKLDIAEVARAAAASGTALEINASWQRLDLKDLHVEQALEAGCMLSINTDAHHTSQLDQMRLGIITARRGGAPARRVINTLALDELRQWKASRQKNH